MRTPSPGEVLAAHKSGARPQTCRALDVVNSVCAEAHQVGARDFSLATIGRLTEQRHGPSMRTLYNEKSAHYRTLISAWADYTTQTNGQLHITPPKPTAEQDLLRKINDPAVRGVFGAIVAERNRLRSELALLRTHTNVVVDRRTYPGELGMPNGKVVQVLTDGHKLLPLEKESLVRAVSPDFLRQEGSCEGPNGEIFNPRGRRLYGMGYATAIRKLLGAGIG